MEALIFIVLIVFMFIDDTPLCGCGKTKWLSRAMTPEETAREQARLRQAAADYYSRDERLREAHAVRRREQEEKLARMLERARTGK